MSGGRLVGWYPTALHEEPSKTSGGSVLNRTYVAAELEPIERRSVFDEVVTRLGDFIMSSGLKSGDKLPAERELTESLRVGRSSLREAVKALRAVGAIDVVAGGGMYVGHGGSKALSKPLSWAVLLNASSLQQTIEAREILEVQLAPLAAERISDEELTELRHLLEHMRAAHNDPEAYLSTDVRFHLTIARASKNDILCYALEMLQHVVSAWIRRTLRTANCEPLAIEEHQTIYDALAARNAPAAREAMRAHLSAASQRLQKEP
jgi:GntR family transcriptional repressor for pyruvate dehydrogenase complex